MMTIWWKSQTSGNSYVLPGADVISALAHGRKRPARHTVLCWLLLLRRLLHRGGAAVAVAVAVVFDCQSI